MITFRNLVTIFIIIHQIGNSHSVDKGIEEINVLENTSVILPCRPASVDKTSVPVIVLWYKGNNTEPFYSYDIRKSGGGTCWSNDLVFGQRAKTDVSCTAVSMLVNPVKSVDRNVYRCRVDFERGPSKAYSLLLNVIVLPSLPIVRNENGIVVNETAGPYHEGENVVLTCHTIGGMPSPSVIWYQDEKIIDNTYDVNVPGQIWNPMKVASLTRNHLDSSYTCRVSNNNITRPFEIKIPIVIILAPLTISLSRLRSSKNYVEAGIIEVLKCTTTGSRPDPVLSWWRNVNEMKDPQVTESAGPNVTTSVLKIRPKPQDLDVIITCRVENTALPGSVLEESFKLDVYYTPKVTLKMGLELNPDEVREDSDIFMDCEIEANPKVIRLNWLHEGEVMYQDLRSGIIIANQTLVMQKVGRNKTGIYQCQAKNIHGTGTSKPIYLGIIYAPICSTKEEKIYQVSKNSRINVTCKVEAEPQNVTYKWQFNSSGGLLKLKNDMVSTRGTTSVLSYLPETEGDYGMILCTARNLIGIQSHPCVFNITASKPPQLLESCEILNQSSDSVFVTCKHIPTELPAAYTMEQDNQVIDSFVLRTLQVRL